MAQWDDAAALVLLSGSRTHRQSRAFCLRNLRSRHKAKTQWDWLYEAWLVKYFAFAWARNFFQIELQRDVICRPYAYKMRAGNVRRSPAAAEADLINLVALRTGIQVCTASIGTG